MLKSFEYVDPVLAQKIHTLQCELKKVEQSRQQILNNKKLTVTTRDKLLKYQNDCGKTIQKLLNEQKDKLAEYLDQQTNVITKVNRLSSNSTKVNSTLNQSTRIDCSTTDDSKSLDITKTSVNRKVSSFYMLTTDRPTLLQSKYPNKNTLKIRQLKKKVCNQQKLIKMLVTWIKIYYERQQNHKQDIDSHICTQNQALKAKNAELSAKCRRLQNQILQIRQQFKEKALNILQTQKMYEQIKNQNSGLKLQRKQLLSNARSLKKPFQN